MKKVLSVLAVLAVAAGFAFAANPATAGDKNKKEFYLTTTKAPKSGFGFTSAALSAYNANQTFDLDGQGVPFAQDNTTETSVGYAAYFTNSKTLVHVTLAATAFKSAANKVTTTIPYTFTVTNVKEGSAPTSGSSDGVAVDVFKETEGDGNRYGSAVIKVTVPQTSWDNASAADDYKATLTLTAAVI